MNVIWPQIGAHTLPNECHVVFSECAFYTVWALEALSPIYTALLSVDVQGKAQESVSCSRIFCHVDGTSWD